MIPKIIITLLDIGIISVIYLLVGLIISDIINESFDYLDGTHDPNNLSTIYLFISSFAQFYIITIIIYIIRNFMEYLPSPFQNINNYNRTIDMIPELQGGIIFSFIILLFQSNLKDKLHIIRERIHIF